MIGIDLGEREQITLDALPGVTFTVGLIPFGKLREIEMRVAPLLAEIRAVTDAGPDEREAVISRVTPQLVEIHTETLRWGLRAWSLLRPLATAPQIYAGRSFDVVAPESFDGLAHVAGGWALIALGGKILDANRLTAEDVLGFK